MSAGRSVLFVSPSAYQLSGLATWLDHLLPALVRRGWRARLALVSGRRHHRPERYLAIHPFTDVLVAHCSSDTAVGRRRALARVLLQSQPDLAVSVNIPDVIDAVNALRLRGQSRARVVMSVHGIESFLYADMQKYKAALDGVICTNRLSCALSATLGAVASERILYASYGVGTGSAPLAAPADSLLRIVFSGRLESAQKRCLDLVGIAAELKKRGVPYLLDIAGDGPDVEQLRAGLAREIADGQVVMHGFVQADELRTRIYPAAHALLITSCWETGPIVAWEAMSQDVCVVSSRYVGSGRERALIDGENALLFGIGDVSAAAAALEQIWKDRGLRGALRQGGRHLVEQRYSIDASADAWDHALNEALTWQPASGVALSLPRERGRLDRWFGVEHAERLRNLFHLQPPPASDPGGEWPHANTEAVSDDAFWQTVREQEAAANMGQDKVPVRVG